MLVLQALIGGFAAGSAAANPPMLDIFGNPLCINDHVSVESGADRNTHTALPDCCTTACSLFAPITTEDRAAHSLANPLAAGRAQPQPPVVAVARDGMPDHPPGRPRAPPATA